MGEEMVLKNQEGLVRFSHRLGESMRKPLWTHGVASKVLRPRFNRAQKTTPGAQMEKSICTTASSGAFLMGDEKCGLGQADRTQKSRCVASVRRRSLRP